MTTLGDSSRNLVVEDRKVNMYMEPTPQGPSKVAKYSRPGLEVLATIGAGPIRSRFSWLGHEVVVSGQAVYVDAVLKSTGVISATGPVRRAFSVDEFVLVVGGLAYDYFGGSLTLISDPDIPASLVDVVYLAGRFVYFTGASSVFAWSDAGDATTIDGLSFATAVDGDARSTVGAAIQNDQMAIFTSNMIEWWYPQDDPDNPFIISQGRQMEKGLAAVETLVLADNTTFFVGGDRIVYKISDVPIRVSDFNIENDMRSLSLANLAALTAYRVVFGGHTFYVLNLPTKTWALDLSNGEWDEWSSVGRARFRPYCCEDNVLGDTYSGRLYGFDAAKYYDESDAGGRDAIERLVSTFIPVPAGLVRNFNAVLRTKRGVGNANVAAPVAQLQWSDDEGANFSGWFDASIGASTDTTNAAKAVWTHLGMMMAPGRLFEARCTDPCEFTVFGFTINTPYP